MEKLVIDQLHPDFEAVYNAALIIKRKNPKVVHPSDLETISTQIFVDDKGVLVATNGIILFKAKVKDIKSGRYEVHKLSKKSVSLYSVAPTVKYPNYAMVIDPDKDIKMLPLPEYIKTVPKELTKSLLCNFVSKQFDIAIDVDNLVVDLAKFDVVGLGWEKLIFKTTNRASWVFLVMALKV